MKNEKPLYLLANFDSVGGLLRDAKHIGLFIDFDGTLTEIVKNPDEAYLSMDMCEIIQKLNSKKKISIGIISGRSLNDLKSRTMIDGIFYAGCHGLEIESNDYLYRNSIAESRKGLMNKLAINLQFMYESIPGVFVENKGLAVSIHYRNCKKELNSQIEKILLSVAQPFYKEIKISPGKMIFEIMPNVEWNKGNCIDYLLQHIANEKHVPSTDILPVYIGDDCTDEDAFKIIVERGISIIISGEINRKTAAKYYLRNPDEVKHFLQILFDNYCKFIHESKPN